MRSKIDHKIALLLAMLLCLGLLSGCRKEETKTEGISVVTTIFPYFDFTREILGGAGEVLMLLPAGSESHTYEPTPKDLTTVTDCDLFLYTGGESDAWADDILQALPHVNSVRMLSALGMEPEDGGHHHDHDHADTDDEHIWTSLRNAVKIVRSISDHLCALAPDHAETFSANAQAYIDRLEALDGEFSAFFDENRQKMMVFGDRFPFFWFARDYGLDCHAAFPGCSSQTEPSAAVMKELITLVEENGISTVYYIEFSNHRVADSIAEATGAKRALFHSCHNVTTAEMEAGETYLTLMEKNLQTLKGGA